jgi:hypothetical protein
MVAAACLLIPVIVASYKKSNRPEALAGVGYLVQAPEGAIGAVQ